MRQILRWLSFLCFFSVQSNVSCENTNSQQENRKALIEQAIEYAKEVESSYELGMRLKKEAIASFEKAEIHKKMAQWYKNNANAFNRDVEEIFLRWIKKEISQGKINTPYKSIISSSKLCKKYLEDFLVIYDAVSHKKVIPFEKAEDVTDKKMWEYNRSIFFDILKQNGNQFNGRRMRVTNAIY